MIYHTNINDYFLQLHSLSQYYMPIRPSSLLEPTAELLRVVFHLLPDLIVATASLHRHLIAIFAQPIHFLFRAQTHLGSLWAHLLVELICFFQSCQLQVILPLFLKHFGKHSIISLRRGRSPALRNAD